MTNGEELSVAEPAGEQSLTPDLRQRLVRQFEHWLDRMMAGEAPPTGMPLEFLAESGQDPSAGTNDTAASTCDLYSLFAAVTTLTGEIRLQGRAFKQLAETLAPVSGIPSQLERLEQLSERQAAQSGGLPVSSEAVCEVMVDLYDRLARGLATCDSGIAALRQRPTGWLERLSGARRAAEQATASTEAIRDAIALTLERLDSVLEQWGVERIGRIGERFDPLRMSAIQVRARSDVEPGTLLEVNRSGFALAGRVRATAQVTVSRAQ